MTAIRVLHVVTYMGRGGLETMIMNYYRHINREQVQFDFLVHREFEADYDKEIEELGGRIYRLPNLNPFSKDYLSKLDEFFATHKEYRIVHSHLDCMAGIPLKYAQKHDVPVRIAHAHNSNQTKDKKYLLKLFFKKNIVKYATDLFACGIDAGKWMFSIDEFQILNNAIDAEKFKYDQNVRYDMRKKWNITEDSLVIGHVGRFRIQKNHEFLLEVFADVLKKKTDAKLVLVGEGEQLESIRCKIQKLGIEKQVIFAGDCDNVSDILQAMDVFVFPSLYEGLPVSVVEAQAAGLPCLISDKVPIECKKTDLVQQIALDVGTEIWADRIIDAAKKTRRDTFEEIQKSGFDIKANAAWLEQFYLNAYANHRGK